MKKKKEKLVIVLKVLCRNIWNSEYTELKCDYIEWKCEYQMKDWLNAGKWEHTEWKAEYIE